MTVATTQISEAWTGDASSVTFPIPFPFLSRSHLYVWKEDAAGTQTPMTILTATGEGESSGGSITLTEPVGVGFTLHVRRNTPKTQETDYVPHDPFPAASHERALDKLTMIVQELIASGAIDMDVDHLRDLLGDSTTIVWSLSPDGTRVIGTVPEGLGDTYKVKVDGSDAAGFLDSKLADTTDVQFSPTDSGEQMDSIVYQLTGLGARLVNIHTNFSWGGWAYGSTLGGRGISPGYAWIGGVHTKVWCANDGVGNLYWTSDDWAYATLDTSLFGIVGPGGLNWHPPCLRYLSINGVPSWVATSDHTGAWYYAHDISGNFNADGTLKPSAWIAGPAAPHLIADIGVSAAASCLVGNHGFITRTTNWTSFTDVYSGVNVIGGIDTDRSGKWIAFERDTGKLLMSTDDGATWTAPQAYIRSSEGVPYVAAATVIPAGSVCSGNGIWLITGASGYAYSYDGIHWTIQNNPLGSFYGIGFDGVKFYAVNPNNVGSPPPVIYQLLASEIPAHRQFVAEKGLSVDLGMWLPFLAGAGLLGTSETGAVVERTGVALDWIGVDPSPETEIPTGDGIMSWNDTEKTIDLQLPDGVTLQLGQETQLIATNNTGATIPNGAAVYVSGATGNRVTIALADADSTTANSVIGVTTQAIANNQSGKVTILGVVRDIDTSSFSEGEAVYLGSTPGQFVAVPSALPSPRVFVGVIARSHAVNGSIFVHPQKNPSVEELGAADNEVVAAAISAIYGRLNEIPVPLNTFGAVDTPGNTTTTLQAAARSGKTVWIPQGTYLCDSVVFDVAGTRFLSEGATIKQRGSAFRESMFSVQADRVELWNLHLDGDGDNPGKPADCRQLLELASGDHQVVAFCKFSNFHFTGAQSSARALRIGFHDVTNFLVTDTTITNITKTTAVPGSGFIGGIFVGPSGPEDSAGSNTQEYVTVPSSGRVVRCNFEDIWTLTPDMSTILSVADSDMFRFFCSDPTDLVEYGTDDLRFRLAVGATGADYELVAGDTIQSSIMGTAIAPVPFAVNHSTTMAAWRTAVLSAFPTANVTVSGSTLTVVLADRTDPRGKASVSSSGTAPVVVNMSRRVRFDIEIADCRFIRPQKRPVKVSGGHGITFRNNRVEGNAPGQFIAVGYDMRNSADFTIEGPQFYDCYGYSLFELAGKNGVVTGVRYTPPNRPAPDLTPLTLDNGCTLRYGVVRMYDKPFSDTGRTQYVTEDIAVRDVEAPGSPTYLYCEGTIDGTEGQYNQALSVYAAWGILPLKNLRFSNIRTSGGGSSILKYVRGFYGFKITTGNPSFPTIATPSRQRNYYNDGVVLEDCDYYFKLYGLETMESGDLMLDRCRFICDPAGLDITANAAALQLYTAGNLKIRNCEVTLPSYSLGDLSGANKAYPIRVNGTKSLDIDGLKIRWTGTGKTNYNVLEHILISSAEKFSIQDVSVEYDDLSAMTSTPYLATHTGTGFGSTAKGMVARTSNPHKGIKNTGILQRLTAFDNTTGDGTQLTNTGTITNNQAGGAGWVW